MRCCLTTIETIERQTIDESSNGSIKAMDSRLHYTISVFIENIGRLKTLLFLSYRNLIHESSGYFRQRPDQKGQESNVGNKKNNLLCSRKEGILCVRMRAGQFVCTRLFPIRAVRR